jgi:hypothetical protein
MKEIWRMTSSACDQPNRGAGWLHYSVLYRYAIPSTSVIFHTSLDTEFRFRIQSMTPSVELSLPERRSLQGEQAALTQAYWDYQLSNNRCIYQVRQAIADIR